MPYICIYVYMYTYICMYMYIYIYICHPYMEKVSTFSKDGKGARALPYSMNVVKRP